MRPRLEIGGPKNESTRWKSGAICIVANGPKAAAAVVSWVTAASFVNRRGELTWLGVWMVPFDVDLASPAAHRCGVMPSLHTEQHIHINTEGLLNPQRHLGRKG